MRKPIAILTAFLLLISLFACTPKLTDGAVVTVTVETDAPDYALSSSYGEVRETGKDRFSVKVPTLRDFLVTVSADGYDTINVYFSVDDLLSGNTARHAVLRTATLHTVELLVKGTNSHAAAVCDGTPLRASGGMFTGEFPASALEQGITVTADGAEPCTVRFSEEALKNIFLQRELYLVPKDHKLVEIFVENSASSFFAVDREGFYLPSEEDAQLSGTTRGVLYRIAVPIGYGGTVRLRPYSCVTEDSGYFVEVDGAATAYSEKNCFRIGTDTDDILFQMSYSFFMGCVQSDRGNPFENLWVETDRYLAPLPKLPDTAFSYVSGERYVITVRAQREMQLRRIYINDPFGENALAIDLENYRGTVIGEDETGAVGSRIDASRRRCIVVDSITGEPYAGTVVYRNGTENEIVSTGKPFPWREEFRPDEETCNLYCKAGTLENVTALDLYAVHGEAYDLVFTVRGEAEYELTLLNDGVALTGAQVVPIFQGNGVALTCIETAPGVYSGEQGIPYGYLVTAGETTYTIAPAASRWQQTGRKFSAVYDLAERQGTILLLTYGGQGRLFTSLRSLDYADFGGQLVRLPINERMLYLLVSYRDRIVVEVEYELYEGEVKREKRRVTLDCAHILSEDADRAIFGRAGYVYVELTDYPLV